MPQLSGSIGFQIDARHASAAELKRARLHIITHPRTSMLKASHRRPLASALVRFPCALENSVPTILLQPPAWEKISMQRHLIAVTGCHVSSSAVSFKEDLCTATIMVNRCHQSSKGASCNKTACNSSILETVPMNFS